MTSADVSRGIAVYVVLSTMGMTGALVLGFFARLSGALEVADHALRVAMVLALSWPLFIALWLVALVAAAAIKVLRGSGAGTLPPVQ